MHDQFLPTSLLDVQSIILLSLSIDSSIVTQGRNLAGQVGLFPQSYTTSVPPKSETSAVTPSTTTDTVVADSSSRSALQPVTEMSETESLADTNTNIAAPQPHAQAYSTLLNQTDSNDAPHDGDRHKRVVSNGSGEVMKATMTDVQQALEQLGRGPSGDRDDRSFSFASSRGENTETEDDYDMSDLDGADPKTGEGWHKRARTKLAAKAKKAVEEAEKLEAMIGGQEISRRLVLPIQVELSDESEGEDGDYTTHTNPLPRRHPYILEEDEESEIIRQDAQKPSSEQDTVKEDSSYELTVSEGTSADPGTATGPQFSLPSDVDPSPNSQSGDASHSYSPVTPVSPQVAGPVVTFQEPKREHTPNPEATLPSPTGSFPGPRLGPHPDRSKYISVMSNYSAVSTASETSPRLPSSTDNTFVEEKETEGQGKVHPSEWAVGDVVDWLKSKGFDQDVCDKFTGQSLQLLPEFCFSDSFGCDRTRDYWRCPPRP